MAHNKALLLFIFILYILVVGCRVEAPVQIPNAFENGVVVSTHELASEVGAEILRKGGNAVDAAVAVAYARFIPGRAISGAGDLW
jgi:gamma-glutamyltranspeptidase